MAGTGAGGGDDGVVAAEGVVEGADQRLGLAPVAGVVVHLAAARLFHGELDGVTEPLQDRGHGLAGVGEERVVVAGDEQRDAHLRPLSRAPREQAAAPSRRSPAPPPPTAPRPARNAPPDAATGTGARRPATDRKSVV